jgi:hypothetical protein
MTFVFLKAIFKKRNDLIYMAIIHKKYNRHSYLALFLSEKIKKNQFT